MLKTYNRSIFAGFMPGFERLLLLLQKNEKHAYKNAENIQRRCLRKIPQIPRCYLS